METMKDEFSIPEMAEALAVSKSGFHAHLCKAERPRRQRDAELRGLIRRSFEQSRPPSDRVSPIPKGFGWDVLVKLDGDDLETHYRHSLTELGKRPGLIGVIFRKAQNKIQDPAKLRRLIADLIDKEEWSSLDTDVKGDAYEGLLQKNAEDVKGGAGQYFTPRPLIQAIVEVMQPRPGEVICDPACGTGGFLLAAHDFIRKHHKLDTATRGSASNQCGATLQSPPQSGMTRTFVSSTPSNSAAWSWWTAWRGSAR